MFSNLCMCVSPCTCTTSEMTFYFESALEIAQSTFLPSGPKRGRGHMLYKWPPSSSLDWVNEKKKGQKVFPWLVFIIYARDSFGVLLIRICRSPSPKTTTSTSSQRKVRRVPGQLTNSCSLAEQNPFFFKKKPKSSHVDPRSRVRSKKAVDCV